MTDREKLRALAEAAVARHDLALAPDVVLDLLSALDAAERERDEAREETRCWRETALAGGAMTTRAEAERDALAAMLRECRDFIEGVCATTFIRSQIANARELVNRIDKSSVSKE
jgi:hypothetical protein